MATTVFVSGATGFIAQHLIKLLLSKGYKVVGSVRSEEKGEKITRLFDSDSFCYEIVPSLAENGAFDKALQNHPEVAVFLHTASPVVLNSTDVDEDLLRPAVKGTKHALDAVHKFGKNVKNVVVTSSVAAMVDFKDMTNPEHTVNEKSWNPASWAEAKVHPWSAYSGLKKYGEKAAWDFMEQENPLFSLNVVNPVYVFGPQAFDAEVTDELNASAENVNRILKLGPDLELPSVEGLFVDVRDVAKAHLVAFEKGISNERLVLTTGDFTSQLILDILNENFDDLKGKLPVGKPGTGRKAPFCQIDHTHTEEILGFEHIDLKTSIVESVSQLLRAREAK